jgi:threonine/homoserine/homoserine lactone efflux protein
MTLDITAWKIQRRDKPQRGYSGLMDLPTLLSFSLFAFVAAFTPGPNNVMLAASGANFGFRASLPHILGVFAGFMILVVAAGFGLASLFTALPALYDILKIISILFLLYLAWKIANAGRAETRHDDRPLRFWQAAMFQLVNPKGITVIISSVTAYTSSAANLASEVLAIFMVLALVTIGSTCTWTLFGILIGQFLKTETRLRLFNIIMASLLLVSLLPVLLS